ncbi:MAG: isochorismatase family protein [Actinomycetota bacterium]|nr:isochorismatase family protein [Actinomycetota bacterium]
MSAGRLLARSRAALVVIDMQEGFRSYETFAATAAACGRLVAGARILEVPVRATEQYPKGLGPTVPEIGLNGIEPIAKTVFSACRAEGFDLAGCDQVLVCGIETHVCVSQTVHDLLEDGREVHVAVDAVGSRHAIDREYGLRKMDGSGAILTTVEAALLELCGEAGTPEFKAVQKVIL